MSPGPLPWFLLSGRGFEPGAAPSGADLPVCLLSAAHVREARATLLNPGTHILNESRRFSTAPGNKKADREVRPTGFQALTAATHADVLRQTHRRSNAGKTAQCPSSPPLIRKTPPPSRKGVRGARRGAQTGPEPRSAERSQFAGQVVDFDRVVGWFG